MLFPFGKSIIALCALSLSANLLGVTTVTPLSPSEKKAKQPFPWLTGPLLTPSGHAIPWGHYNIEPYEFVTANVGLYDADWKTHSTPNFYNVNTQTIVQIGLPWNFDCYFSPAWSWNHLEKSPHLPG